VPPRGPSATSAQMKFKDNDQDHYRKNYTSIDQYDEKSFDLKRMELDSGVQVGSIGDDMEIA
jgi:hypothetical protein